ncbi:CAP domain-containing protein [Corallococcus sp. bb12-1]|uniref:CAP domain-containing protein n=1 Tax=Corallococcus sp. bb12-1 TaxID=2996784 RepID=UPI00226F2DC8|nr:CAP domain-containing protein [Corallococcus sp. bb12-1]MCY1041546.1 CAP domain-containing protein [Corallococcus sp. bb12-1]
MTRSSSCAIPCAREPTFKAAPRHPTSPLVWSQSLAASAQKWADQSAKTCGVLKLGGGKGHPDYRYVGENLYTAWSKAGATGFDASAAVKSWAAEARYVRFSSNHEPLSVDGHQIGNYTQMVWRDTTALGCGAATCTDPSKPATPPVKLYVCHYGPGGNYSGARMY